MAESSQPIQSGERIAVDPNILNGKPHLAGTRLAVDFVQGLLATGWTHQELLVTYPYLTPEDITAAIQYPV